MDGADFGGSGGFNGPGDSPGETSGGAAHELTRFPLTAEQRARAYSRKPQDRWIRGLDIALATVALVFLSPLLLLIALLVRMDRAGPALFRQHRFGLGGECFEIYKFRTMRVMESGDAFTQATRNDARVTWLGKFLRRSSLDELPQLINVIKGDMSLVGPRPHPTSLDLRLAETTPGYGNRFLTRPGITGLAQVRGFRGELLTPVDVRGRILNDVLYARRRCVMLYVGVVCLTAFVFIFQSRAY